jgi:hypothetical protein
VGVITKPPRRRQQEIRARSRFRRSGVVGQAAPSRRRVS